MITRSCTHAEKAGGLLALQINQSSASSIKPEIQPNSGWTTVDQLEIVIIIMNY